MKRYKRNRDSGPVQTTLPLESGSRHRVKYMLTDKPHDNMVREKGLLHSQWARERTGSSGPQLKEEDETDYPLFSQRLETSLFVGGAKFTSRQNWEEASTGQHPAHPWSIFRKLLSNLPSSRYTTSVPHSLTLKGNQKFSASSSINLLVLFISLSLV